jgi:hypothetical protein
MSIIPTPKGIAVGPLIVAAGAISLEARLDDNDTVGA